MSTRAHSLAEQFEQVNAAAIAAVEATDDHGWQATCTEENWPVAFTAWHIADGHTTIMGLIDAAAAGEPVPPITPAMLDANNAGNAAQHATCSRQEALDLLRQNGSTVATTIRGLGDEQLDRAAVIELFGDHPLSAQQLIELVLIGHARQHTPSLRGVPAAV